ncbi:MAG: hypothetical protein IJY09_06550, partial [Lachnospiraceae bacterium]|nr:hypothetical protein [Lachnospiraceae bacterium]
MRKSVVAKIMSILLLLFVVYMAGSVINSSNSNKVKQNVEELNEIFMEIRVTQKDLVTSIETVKMYCNMIATSSAQDSQERMAGFMPDEVALLNTHLETIEGLCSKIGDEIVVESYKAYRAAVEKLAAIGTKVANSYKQGDMAAALEAQGGMYGSVKAMDG